MYNKIKEYFTISRREFRGMVVLFIIFFFIYFAPYVYERFFFKPLEIKVETIVPDLKVIDEFDNRSSYESHADKEDVFNEPVLFNFNPNHLPVEDWMKLGLSQKQAQTIKKYESKGGRFYKKEDLKKIYSISDKQYKRLEPYIHIPENTTNFNTYKEDNLKLFSRPEKKEIKVSINSADSAELTSIRGIGPSFAARILKYRKRLGGFIHKEQMLEVYGIDSAKFQQIHQQIVIDDNIRKIAINTCTFEELKSFPYLTYKQMNAILAYRKQHGPYMNISDLNKIHILNPEIIAKIAPYLQF